MPPGLSLLAAWHVPPARFPHQWPCIVRVHVVSLSFLMYIYSSMYTPRHKYSTTPLHTTSPHACRVVHVRAIPHPAPQCAFLRSNPVPPPLLASDDELSILLSTTLHCHLARLALPLLLHTTSCISCGARSRCSTPCATVSLLAIKSGPPRLPSSPLMNFPILLSSPPCTATLLKNGQQHDGSGPSAPSHSPRSPLSALHSPSLIRTCIVDH